MSRHIVLTAKLNFISRLPRYKVNQETKKLIRCGCNKDELKLIKHYLGDSYINHIIDEIIENLKELRNDS